MRYNAWKVLTLAGTFGTVMPGLLTAQSGPQFQRFTAGGCFHSREVVKWLATRDAPDTTIYRPQKDTTLRVVWDSARACALAVGGAAGQPLEQQLNYARIQWIEGLDAEARTMVERYLQTVGTSSIERRAWALYLVIHDELAASPPRMAFARADLAALDQLGASAAAKARLFAHHAMALAARRQFDDQTVRTEAGAVLTAWQQLPDEKFRIAFVDSVVKMIIRKAEIELRTHGGDAARTVIDSARAVIPERARGEIESYARMLQLVGTRAAPIEAHFWYRTMDAAPRPALGKVTILNSVDHSCRPDCRPSYQAMNRYVARFGSRGLELVNMTRTFGFFVDTAPVTPVREAQYDSVYFLERIRLQGALAVYQTKYSRSPRDHSRLDEATPQRIHYANAEFIIVDKRGIVRYIGRWDQMLEEPMAQLIDQLLLEEEGAGGP